jgi:hypothetical protein
MLVIRYLKEISNTWIRNASATISFIVVGLVMPKDLLNAQELNRNRSGIYLLV